MWRRKQPLCPGIRFYRKQVCRFWPRPTSCRKWRSTSCNEFVSPLLSHSRRDTIAFRFRSRVYARNRTHWSKLGATCCGGPGRNCGLPDLHSFGTISTRPRSVCFYLPWGTRSPRYYPTARATRCLREQLNICSSKGGEFKRMRTLVPSQYALV